MKSQSLSDEFSAIGGFVGAYENSRKEPDLMIRPDNQLHPSLVVETGWSESHPQLERDMRLWLMGTEDVQVVLILKWRRSSDKVKGSLEAWKRDPYGMPIKTQTAVCTSCSALPRLFEPY
jgi:hypothetical protein